jgi:hypothetical protein
MLNRMGEIDPGELDPHEAADRVFGGCGDPACPTGTLVAEPVEPIEADPADQHIWCAVELADVAAIIDEYQLWKHDPWFGQVDWAVVSAVLDRLLQANAVDGDVQDVVGLASVACETMRPVDAEGLAALVMEPITATRVQLTNGGHRLKAMRDQGVTCVPGLFVRDDVPGSVPPERVYPRRGAAVP